MGNQDISMIWNILNILKILMSTIYLMFPPLMLEKFSGYEVNKYVAEGGVSQIMIYLIQCMFTFHNIKSKI